MKEEIIEINIPLKLVGKKRSKNIFNRIKIFFTSNPYIWETIEDMQFDLGEYGIITIEKGFRCDLASVPQFLQNILPSHPPSTKAYILHDWIYKKDFKREEMGDKVNRKWADDLMLKYANDLWDNKLDNYIRYFGVRLFGGFIYKR